MKTRDEQIRNIVLKKRDICLMCGQNTDKIQALEKEVERLSAPLTIPEGEIENIPDTEVWSEYEQKFFDKGVRWALEYLNAQRGVKP